MGNDLVKLLREALTKAEKLEKENSELKERNKQLEEEIGNVNVEKWQLSQENDKLKKDVGHWKSVAFKR